MTNLGQKLNDEKILKFNDYLFRRLKNEPIAYILKEKEFWSKKFIINKHTLIPRPETELLVDKCIKIYKNREISVLDIGTGSGCIIISLLHSMEQSKGVGIDISKKAILIAKKNAKKFDLLNRIKFFNKSVDSLFNKKFDLIVSNPPYIEQNLKNLSEDIKNTNL